MSDWIVIPNWDVYQHYKRPDPVWLRDYVRQLWSRQWTELSLPQRGLLWTGRLAYAHHNGQLLVSDLQHYTPRYERSHVPAIAERLNHAGLMGLFSRQPLSLSLDPVTRARVSASSSPNGAGPVPSCQFCEQPQGRHTADCPTLQQRSLLDELTRDL